MLKEPDKMAYWVDFKNLSADNAKDAFVVFDNLIDKYNIQNRFFIESQDIKALKIAKRKNYHVMLWVENIYYWDTPKKYTPENVEFTKKLCEEKSVKVVLVDYPTPEF